MERYYPWKLPRMPDGSFPFEPDGTPRDGIIYPTGWNSFLHHIRRGDEAWELHNHPWRWWVSIVLSGGYREERLERGWAGVRIRVLRPGSINFMTDSAFHRIDVLDERRGCWTLFLHGPKSQGWGFLDRDTRQFLPWREFIKRARETRAAA
jgi:hypothetical protein